MMNKKLMSLLFATLGATGTMAQNNKLYEGRVHMVANRMAKVNDSVFISIDFQFQGVNVNKHQTLELIPVLSGDSIERELPLVALKGRTAYREYQRFITLLSDEKKKRYNTPLAVFQTSKDFENAYSYRYSFKFEPWMQSAHLDMKTKLCACGGEQGFSERLSDIVDMNPDVKHPVIPQEPGEYVCRPSLVYVQPHAEVVKKREKALETFLDFAVNKVDIRPDYMDNPRELKKIRDMIDELQADKSISIRTFDIIGYASPEGTVERNQWLSEHRAKALQDYLAGLYSFPASTYKVRFGGENWDGLVDMINSDASTPQADRVLDVIERYSVEAGRETILMRLGGGVPYRYLLKNMFPHLRKVVCKVEYDIKNFDIDEAKTVLLTHPQNLSLNEMFNVAQTYRKGSPEFAQVFDVAVKMYPESKVANLNAAVSALERNELVQAKRFLENADAPDYHKEYLNTFGVYKMLTGELDVAETLFNEALHKGMAEASENLREVQNKRQNLRLKKEREELLLKKEENK